MAIDSYMYFMDSTGKLLQAESQVDFSKSTNDKLGANFINAAKKQSLFEVKDYSFGVEQTLNLGSQSSGTGAGKITMNPFSFTRAIDVSTPSMFLMACNGMSFKTAALGLRKSVGGESAGMFFLVYTFALAAVKTIDWSHDDESPKETVSLEYGALRITYAKQNPDGTMAAGYTEGWNKVKNVRDQDPTKDILGNAITF